MTHESQSLWRTQSKGYEALQRLGHCEPQRYETLKRLSLNEGRGTRRCNNLVFVNSKGHPGGSVIHVFSYPTDGSLSSLHADRQRTRSRDTALVGVVARVPLFRS